MTLGDPTVLPTSVDAFLGGRFAAIQPLNGHHRAGLDAILLAAVTDDGFAARLVDLGAGVGVAGFSVAARHPAANVVLAERDPSAMLCASASLGLDQNKAFAGRVETVTVDALDPAAREAAGLEAGSFDVVIMNPPFHEEAMGTAPPAAARRAAYVLEAGLDPWFRAGASLLMPRGSLAIIFRADRLDALLAAARGRFGSIAILPIAPRAHAPATRVVLVMRKGSRAPLRLLPPLVLHPSQGSGYLPAAQALLRDGASLSAVHPGWTGIG